MQMGYNSGVIWLKINVFGDKKHTLFIRVTIFLNVYTAAFRLNVYTDNIHSPTKLAS